MQVSQLVQERSNRSVKRVNVVEWKHAISEEDGIEREGVDGQFEEVCGVYRVSWSSS